MTQHGFRILIVDDEPNIRTGLAKGLAGEADELCTAADAEQALAEFRRYGHQVVITDLKMPGRLSGIDLLREIKQTRPETVVLVITAHGTIETAVEAMRHGAHDFVAKPVDLSMLRLQVRNAWEHYRLVEENRRLRERLNAMGEIPDMVGRSAAMQHVFDRIRQVGQCRRLGVGPGRERHRKRTRGPSDSQPERSKEPPVHRRQSRLAARIPGRKRVVRLRKRGF
jgi:DNA-binding NtrC family response regulator